MACSTSHFGRFHALTLFSAAIWPPAFLTALSSLSGALSGPPRGRRRRRSASWDRRRRAPARRARPRTPSSAPRRRRSRTAGPSRTSSCPARRRRAAEARVALEDLDAGHAGRALGHRAQPRAPLGDAAVVVAVDQVGGAEAGHGGEDRARAGRCPQRSRRLGGAAVARAARSIGREGSPEDAGSARRRPTSGNGAQGGPSRRSAVRARRSCRARGARGSGGR